MRDQQCEPNPPINQVLEPCPTRGKRAVPSFGVNADLFRRRDPALFASSTPRNH
jgi:hypothetical protein